ncbi:MAG: DNA primase catalytic subunit PriS [Candidatus Micrarchaeota archaeon]|nr:DNA primase catalytic subunit PriS [Candidatus Micrarchaeota archaeon]
MQQLQDAGGLGIAKKLISSYYAGAKDIAPDKVEQREFGVGNFQTKIAFRHMRFIAEKDLRAYLSNNAIPYVSCSAAYYKYPDARPMERKGWEGSELVFDLDVTDMDLKCQLRHGKSWICSECLDAVKAETIKLIEKFLVPDFGFAEKDISVNFSGNRGYHVHVKNEGILKLDGNARKQITDYIAGIGITFEELFPNAGERGAALRGPRPDAKGWKGKLARNFISSLNSGIDSLTELGIDRKDAANLYRKRSLVLMGINSGNWDMIYIKNKADFWKRTIEVQSIRQSDRIDRNVTNDPSHLIRLPNSIHGETGLLARKLVSTSALYRFDPMTDAIAFGKGEVEMTANSRYEVRMNGQAYGPYDGNTVKVPVYVGIYLYLKGAAEIRNLN